MKKITIKKPIIYIAKWRFFIESLIAFVAITINCYNFTIKRSVKPQEFLSFFREGKKNYSYFPFSQIYLFKLYTSFVINF